MLIRGCPAAVSGNESRHEALALMRWEAAAGRNAILITDRRAREPEDLPMVPRACVARLCASEGEAGRNVEGSRRRRSLGAVRDVCPRLVSRSSSSKPLRIAAAR